MMQRWATLLAKWHQLRQTSNTGKETRARETTSTTSLLSSLRSITAFCGTKRDTHAGCKGESAHTVSPNDKEENGDEVVADDMDMVDNEFITLRRMMYSMSEYAAGFRVTIDAALHGIQCTQASFGTEDADDDGSGNKIKEVCGCGCR